MRSPPRAEPVLPRELEALDSHPISLNFLSLHLQWLAIMSANHLKGLDISLFCGIGSGTPPEGTTANLIDPPTLGPAAWGITISMTVWALLFTLARVYVNFRKLKASDCKSSQGRGAKRTSP